LIGTVRTMAVLPREPWLRLLPADPRPWLLDSGEPASRWVTLTELLDRDRKDAEVRAAKRALIADRGTRELIARLPDWEKETVASGHNSPNYAPNILHLLADMGLASGDARPVDRFLDQLAAHQDEAGRFQVLGRWRGQAKPHWGALLCDSHIIADALVRFGRADDPGTRRALDLMAADLASTAQGLGWPCIPDPVTKFRGPGRRTDFCPQVTLEALRTFARVPAALQPRGILDAARTSLRAWQLRGDEKPYLFGHGRQFKTVKWPAFWYGALWLLDALSMYPGLWRGRSARPEDRRAIAEIAACLVAYNVDPDGKVTPRSCFKGFERFSFGQKKAPSAFATARLCVVLRRLGSLAEDIAAVDVRALASSKGGKGTAVPPQG
jgi:hypothetical protein